jgi:hypothetical protein
MTEGVLRRLVRQMQGQAEDATPLAQAQAIVEQAYEAGSERRRVGLAEEALALCPDCADAYVLLAEHARTHKAALDLYEKAVAAGERAIGPRAFQEDVGHFWGLLETRPYMRARLGLAHALWAAGRRDEAVRHLQEMLRLNPNDNQGVRYTLAGFLLFLDRDDDLARLLRQYADEASAAWAYTGALLAFRRHGDTPEARRLLKAAVKTNRHVPAYLLGEKLPPAEPPDYYSPGDENEALDYLGTALAAWKATPGAVGWLRENIPAKKAGKGPRPKGPRPSAKALLNARLPQEPDVWQADFRQLPSWITVGGARVRPWMILVTSRSHGLVLAHDLSEEEPSSALLWEALVRAMRDPAAGTPHRPTVVQVRADDRWESLQPHAEAVGIELAVAEELDQMEDVLADLAEHVGGSPPPGVLDGPGVTPELVGHFYEAAAAFYRQAPWKAVGYEAAIKVECDAHPGGPWYAVLMGQSGLTTGLALYDDLTTLRAMWAGDSTDDEENARQSVATVVTFGEEADTPAGDVDAARRHGWPVARPDAWPSVFHKERGLTLRPPEAGELELLEGCLRAIPAFVSRRRQDDPAREEVTVPVASGPLKLALSWVVENGS